MKLDVNPVRTWTFTTSYRIKSFEDLPFWERSNQRLSIHSSKSREAIRESMEVEIKIMGRIGSPKIIIKAQETIFQIIVLKKDVTRVVADGMDFVSKLANLASSVEVTRIIVPFGYPLNLSMLTQ